MVTASHTAAKLCACMYILRSDASDWRARVSIIIIIDGDTPSFSGHILVTISGDVGGSNFSFYQSKHFRRGPLGVRPWSRRLPPEAVGILLVLISFCTAWQMIK